MGIFFLIIQLMLCIAFALLGMSIWLSCFIFLTALVSYKVFSASDKTVKKPLVESKVILGLSFWSCIALALGNYEKSLTCLNCMRSYLNTHLQPTFGTNFLVNTKLIWQNYPRFLSVCGLLICWSILFIVLQYKKGKTK